MQENDRQEENRMSRSRRYWSIRLVIKIPRMSCRRAATVKHDTRPAGCTVLYCTVGGGGERERGGVRGKRSGKKIKCRLAKG